MHKQAVDRTAPVAKAASRRLELFISYMLIVGVGASCVITVAGFLLYWLTGSTGYPAGAFPVHVADIMAGVVVLKPFAVVNLGLWILVLTPIFRVICSAVAFAAEQDYLYTGITMVVLVVLAIGLVLGKGGH